MFNLGKPCFAEYRYNVSTESCYGAISQPRVYTQHIFRSKQCCFFCSFFVAVLLLVILYILYSQAQCSELSVHELHSSPFQDNPGQIIARAHKIKCYNTVWGICLSACYKYLKSITRWHLSTRCAPHMCNRLAHNYRK